MLLKYSMSINFINRLLIDNILIEILLRRKLLKYFSREKVLLYLWTNTHIFCGFT